MHEPRGVRRIGHITPSSNTVLEPLVARMSAELVDAATQHFTRLAVRNIGLDAPSTNQFALEGLLDAATLLAQAPLDAIVWNGTAGSWLGSAHDERIIDAIRAATGLPATTATRSIFATLRRHSWTRVALAVPYTSDVTKRIVDEYARNGIDVVHHVSLELVDNIAMGSIEEAGVADLATRAHNPAADCIAVVCTNVSTARLTAALEERLGLPIVDSVIVTFAEGCRLAGLSPRLDGWGRVLAAIVA